ncbi:hypothetical protein P20652_3648 [Pseudoalteromonas sp. BSi20652]|nr:hypothetical protein P20652_3648 [Pseudoalteromonas sp. BSi20652]
MCFIANFCKKNNTKAPKKAVVTLFTPLRFRLELTAKG